MVEIKNRYTDEVICTGETLLTAVKNNLANLSYANLRGAYLSGADLSGANLSYANLRGANLSYANLRGAYLSGAYLSYANLRGANLSYANLRGANLSYADISYANLSYANLSYADISYANLSYAVLRGAVLRGADISGADISYADISYAVLRGARVAWQSHDMLSELLRRSAGDDIAKLKVAGLLLVCRDKCWQHFAEIAARDPLGDWALETLAEWVQDGDGAPEIVASRRSTQEAKT